MKIIISLILLISFSLMGCASKPMDSSSNWDVSKVVEQTIYFKNGKGFKTNLYDLKYIDQLKTANKAPYLILSGRSCLYCDAPISIYIWSPDDGAMKAESQQTRYLYPGTEKYYMPPYQSLYEGRMFYGNCLGFESAAWVQKTLNDENKWESSVFIAKVENDTLSKTESNKSQGLLNQLLSESASCHELPGQARTSSP